MRKLDWLVRAHSEKYFWYVYCKVGEGEEGRAGVGIEGGATGPKIQEQIAEHNSAY